MLKKIFFVQKNKKKVIHTFNKRLWIWNFTLMVCVTHISSKGSFQSFRAFDELFSFYIKVQSIPDLNKVMILSYGLQ